MRDATSIDDLLAIMARLRDPERGCPWDLKQSFRSILPYTLEEAYEVAEAIERDDMNELCDELGDLLLQVVFHAQMAGESGSFGFADVVHGICDKMLRRHPHVFGGADFTDEHEVNRNWERETAAERERKAEPETGGLLHGVAQALPALVRAQKLQRRAARVAFDWDDVEGVVDKVREELAECEQTIADRAGSDERVHEIGDLLFASVNLARHLDVDAEQALRAANQRFERRFALVESGLRGQGKEPGPDVRDEMERLWELAKTTEREGCES
jgi:nucleoside triphosphate diphosphatase